MLGIGIIGDNFAREIHLAFALFLAAATFPAFKSSPRDRIPLADWAIGIAGAGASLYLLVFYRDLIQRPGLPTTADIVATVIGVLVLLAAARRAVGLAIRSEELRVGTECVSTCRSRLLLFF